MSNRDDEELADLLADLERTLTDLRAAVDEDVRQRRRRPPTPGELLRFTETHTIPTLIALLEATVRSLELLRALLQLAGPGPRRAAVDEEAGVRGRLYGRDGPDVETLRDALTDLREALTGTDLPEGSAAGSVLADARDLTEEIDDRLADAAEGRDARAERGDAGERRSDADERRDDETTDVAIDVREESDVDVDAELTSIKESMREEKTGDDDAE